MRTSWHEKTENLNMEKDGEKLWNLTRQLNGEENKYAPIILEKDGKHYAGKIAANILVDNYKAQSETNINRARNREVLLQTRN